jgi:hypothetical protein
MAIGKAHRKMHNFSIYTQSTLGFIDPDKSFEEKAQTVWTNIRRKEE